MQNESQENAVKDELLKYNPKEILIGGEAIYFKTLSPFIKDKLSACVTMLDDKDFSYADAEKTILERFRAESLEKLGLNNCVQTVSAVGALLAYLMRTQINGLERISKIEMYSDEQYMHLDFNTRRNLELTEPLNSKNKAACLLSVLDKTKYRIICCVCFTDKLSGISIYNVGFRKNEFLLVHKLLFNNVLYIFN